MRTAFVLTVDLQVKHESVDDFERAININAAASVREEKGCFQFDVLRDAANPERFCLYEVYADKAAFDYHLAQPHTVRFLEQSKPMVESQSHRIFVRVAAPAKTGENGR